MDERWKYFKGRVLDILVVLPRSAGDVLREHQLQRDWATLEGGSPKSGGNSTANTAPAAAIATSPTLSVSETEARHSRLSKMLDETFAYGSESEREVTAWMNADSTTRHITLTYSLATEVLSVVDTVVEAAAPPDTLLISVLRTSPDRLDRRDASFCNSMLFSTAQGNPLQHSERLLREVYLPLLKRTEGWGYTAEMTKSRLLKQCYNYQEVLERANINDTRDNFLESFTSSLEDTMRTMNSVKLSKDASSMAKIETLFSKWCRDVEAFLQERPALAGTQPETLPEEAGPSADIEWWCARQARFVEVLRVCGTVEVQAAMHSLQVSVLHRHNELAQRHSIIERSVSEASSETAEHVKYLASLEKFVEVLYIGPPAVIEQVVPSLLSHVHLMASICQYYAPQTTKAKPIEQHRRKSRRSVANTIDKKRSFLDNFEPAKPLSPRKSTLLAAVPKEGEEVVGGARGDRLLRLLCLITNRILFTSKEYIKEGGRLWVQAAESSGAAKLIQKLNETRSLLNTFKTEYTKLKKKDTAAVHAQFSFDDRRVFGRLDLCCRRIDKLVDVFTTIKQYRDLNASNITGIEQVTSKFEEIADILKKNTSVGMEGADLLDYSRPGFDREYNFFGKRIVEFESTLQVFINAQFEHITRTDCALDLIHKFQKVLANTTLNKFDLSTKYMVVLYQHGVEIDRTQKLFEKHKNKPPIGRNESMVSGSIQWSRLLLRRIEAPMQLFEQKNTALTNYNSKDCKLIVKNYNKLARRLVEFEQMWFDHWTTQVGSVQRCLNATLLIRDGSKLLINFDSAILSLAKETPVMLRIAGHRAVPEEAKRMLLQYPRYKKFHAELTFVLSERERVFRKVSPILKSVLSVLMSQVEDAARSGETLLTWCSLSIDTFLAKFHEAILAFDIVVTKVNDILHNRIQRNLKEISHCTLVSFSKDVMFALEEFTSTQEANIVKQCKLVTIKSREVEDAVDEAVALIVFHEDCKKTPLIGNVHNKFVGFKAHFFSLILQSVAVCQNRSLKMIAQRITPPQTGFMAVKSPFFEVSVQLAGSQVLLHPCLKEIHTGVVHIAKCLYECTKKIPAWSGIPESPVTFFDEINGTDLQAVYSSLTQQDERSGIMGLGHRVSQYLSSFDRYNSLWVTQRDEAFQKFLNSNPSLQVFERKIKQYAEEAEIDIGNVAHVVGCVQLDTKALLRSLREAAVEWRDLFATCLHTTAEKTLDILLNEITEYHRLLGSDPGTLEGLRALMTAINKIREKEAEVALRFAPVQEMYFILRKPAYNIHIVTAEEYERVGEMQVEWRRLRALAERKSDQIGNMQNGFKFDLVHSVQRFRVSLTVFRNDFEEHGPSVPGLPPEEANNRLKKYTRLFEDKLRTWKTLTAGEDLFGMPHFRFPELSSTAKEISQLSKLYSLFGAVKQKMTVHGDALWVDIKRNSSIDLIEQECSGFIVQCRALPRAVKQRDAFKELEATILAFGQLRPLITNLATEYLQARHWQELMEITGASWRLEPDVFKLKHLIDADLINYLEAVEEVATRAEKECQVDLSIEKVLKEWASAAFEFDEWRGRGALLLKNSVVSEIKEKLEESQMLLGGINPKYLEPFRNIVKTWMSKLVTSDKVIDLWLEVQQHWQALEAVFSGGDITKQMPTEAKKFNHIDKQWFKVISRAQENPIVVSLCTDGDLFATLTPLREGLEGLQRQLSAYLETKKRAFPRFYFVADKELLDILSQASDPTAIQPYVKKLFDGVSHVNFARSRGVRSDKQEVQAATLISAEGEQLQLVDSVRCIGHVEEWLGALVREMQATVKTRVSHIALELANIRNPTAPYLDKYAFSSLMDAFPSQCVLLAVQLLWTADITEYITSSKAEKAAKARELGREHAKEGRFNELLEFLIHKTREINLNQRQRTAVETLITIHEHQVEIWRKSIYSANRAAKEKHSFEWLKQSRFYYNVDHEAVLVSICDTDKEYCNEYLGVKERLVITPLTDRCYITLSQALAMKLGGAPAGPAGTGKTETTKDLGRSYGVYVVVFNCSDQMDRNAMGKIVKGLAQASAWGCFDEFNRIALPVLSVVAQQMECVLKALKEHKQEFRFVDDTICSLKQGVGYFITMNPGYAGRQELPENLKNLFRGVTMMVPDRKIIMRVKLASSGYTEKDTLSEKFFHLYKLCEQQLSKQQHYDFGLRNILSVLRSSGTRLRRAMEASRKEGKEFEEHLFMRTLLDMNMSKLVFEDVKLFLDLLQDIFPGKHPDIEADAQLTRQVTTAWEEVGFVFHPKLFDKSFQLHELLKVRHGIMVVGPSLCGKTSILEALQKATSEDGSKTSIIRMYPKAITAQEMFGQLDSTTGEWADGVFSHIWKKTVSIKSGNIWITCDGPIDALWVENLNTVLDDNKLLTLAGGDRIPMTDNMKCCFEVENLHNASPATVSRAGIVYISERELGWNPVLRAKLQAKETDSGLLPKGSAATLSPSITSVLTKLFFTTEPHYCIKENGTKAALYPKHYSGPREKRPKEFENEAVYSVANVVNAVWEIYCKDCYDGVMKSSLVHFVLSTYYLIVAMVGGDTHGGHDRKWSEEVVTNVFWFAVVWTFGGMLHGANVNSAKRIFDEKLRGLTDTFNTDFEEATVFDKFIDVTHNRWVPWEETMRPFAFPTKPDFSFSELFVPTVDSTRLEFLLEKNFVVQRAVLLIGSTGVAKTVTAENFLLKLLQQKTPQEQRRQSVQRKSLERKSVTEEEASSEAGAWAYKKLNFSHTSTTRSYYDNVLELVEKKVGSRGYGPKREKKIVLFIDDISMPEVNAWGDQVTNEVVRQHMAESGMYSLDKTNDFLYITDFAFLACMATPGGGNNDVPHRLKPHFSSYCVPMPEDSSLEKIFGAYIEGKFLQGGGGCYSEEFREVLKQLPQLSIECWKKVSKKLLPTPAKFHYVFSLRDLSLLFQGVMKCDTELFFNVEDVATPIILLLRLWRHEATRVFADRLVDAQDKQWFDSNLDSILSRFDDETAFNVGSIPKQSYFVDFLGVSTEIDPETGSLMPQSSLGGSVSEETYRKRYLPVETLIQLKDKLRSMVQVYNATEGKAKRLDLVLFDAAVKHIVRIARLLSMQRGNMLLVGVGGSGKRSLARLAAFLSDNHLHQLATTPGYGLQGLTDDFRELFKIAGLKKPVAFIISDSSITSEKFLEIINIFLSTGEIQGLWDKDPTEREEILQCTFNLAVKEGAGDNLSHEFLYSYFVRKVRDNLHLVLCFSPGEAFRRRAREFPAIVSCCVDWFFPWPDEALVEVASVQLKQFSLNERDADKQKLLRCLAHVHQIHTDLTQDFFLRYRRVVHTTPRSYLTLLSTFQSLYSNKNGNIQTSATKIQKGLARLDEAGVQIRIMKKDLQEQEATLATSKREIQCQLVDVKEASRAAALKEEEVCAVKDTLAGDAANVQEQKDEANKELELALPALESAKQAATDITSSDLRELQGSANNPAHLTRVVMDGVLILMHYSVLHPISATELRKGGRVLGRGNGFITPSWDLRGNGMDAKFCAAPFGGGGKKFISNGDCVRQILDFTERRKDYINEETCEFLDPYLDLPEFKYEDAWSTSHALGGLCKWVVSMRNYIKIARVVEPKMENLRMMEASLRQAKAKLRAKENELQQVNSENQRQRSALSAKEEELAKMEHSAEETTRRVSVADKLIADLRGERDRWTAQYEANKVMLTHLVGDTVVCSAFLTYCGAYNFEYRQHVVNDVLIKTSASHSLPVSSCIRVGGGLVSFLESDDAISDWQLQGLPLDEHSMQNAIMVSHNVTKEVPRYALFVDPQRQGVDWLKRASFVKHDDIMSGPSPETNDKMPLRHEAPQEEVQPFECPPVRIVHSTDKDLFAAIQEQMENGQLLIVDNIGESIDPCFDPILNHQVVKGRKPYINLVNPTSGEEIRMDYSSGFKIFFITKLSNPKLPPEVFAKLSVIDFTVTMNGLEEQLLSDVIKKEKFELEQERERLVLNMSLNKKMLASLEERLLSQLSSSTSNLIDDEDVILTLSENKVHSAELTEKQLGAEETRKRLDVASSEYQPFAVRGSVLYFVVVEMALVNPMYQSSLAQFRSLFDLAVAETPNSSGRRIDAIVAKLTDLVFNFVDCGLYTRHKLLFVILIACNVLRRDKLLSPELFQLFLKGGSGGVRNELARPKPFEWLSERAWDNVLSLDELSKTNTAQSMKCSKCLEGFANQIVSNEREWRVWYDSDTPELMTIPDTEHKPLPAFERFLIVRSIREDRTLVAARTFVQHTLGPQYSTSQPPNLEEILSSTDELTPIIYLLSPGADPSSLIYSLAKKRRKVVKDIAMGEGQEGKAMGIVKQVLPEGGWGLLQNCHLSPRFLANLELHLGEKQALKKAGQSVSHSEAKLWITGEPSEDFPIGLLQMSIKLTNEPPVGIKAGLVRSFAVGSGLMTQELLDSFRRSDWKNVVFAATFLHSLVQERKKFGAIGFSVPYTFNNGDLSSSLMFLSNHFTQIGDDVGRKSEKSQVNWETVGYMLAKILYGGRITDEKDQNLFNVIVSSVMNPQVLQEGYQFAEGFKMPVFEEISKYRYFLEEQYPDVDTPDVFGLHPNAEIAYRQQTVWGVVVF